MSDSQPKSIFNKVRLEGGFTREDGTDEVLYYAETGRLYPSFESEARIQAIAEYQAMGAAVVDGLATALKGLGEVRKTQLADRPSNLSENQPW